MSTAAGATVRLPSSVGAVLEAYRGLLMGRFGDRLAELRLFGSYARGEAHTDAESDVDVLVVVRGLTEQERDVAVDLAYDARTSVDDDVLLTPVVYSEAQASELRERERGLLRAIDAEGIAL